MAAPGAPGVWTATGAWDGVGPGTNDDGVPGASVDTASGDMRAPVATRGALGHDTRAQTAAASTAEARPNAIAGRNGRN